MSFIIEQVIFGLSVGCTYALIALAITLVFRGMDLINFATGEIFMIGAFLGYVFYVDLKLPFLVALLLSIVIAYLFGSFLELVFFRKLEGSKDGLTLLLMTIALFIILRNVAQLIFGSSAYRFPPIVKEDTITFLGITLNPQYLIIISATILLMIGLYLLFAKTKIGLCLRAVAQNKTTAQMMGISVSKMNNVTFSLCAVLGAIAGILYAPIVVVSFNMGDLIMLKGFTGAMLGGLGIVPGAVIGGILLGIIEQFSTIYVSSAYKDLISFSLLLLIILLKPNGLFGKKVVKKV